MAPAGVDEVKTDMAEGVQKKCRSRQVFLRAQFGEGQDDRQLSAERSGQGRRYSSTKAGKHVVRTGGMLESVDLSKETTFLVAVSLCVHLPFLDRAG